MFVLDERHEVDVLLATDDEDALASVTVGVRMFQDVEHVAALDVAYGPAPMLHAVEDDGYVLQSIVRHLILDGPVSAAHDLPTENQRRW